MLLKTGNATIYWSVVTAYTLPLITKLASVIELDPASPTLTKGDSEKVVLGLKKVTMLYEKAYTYVPS